MNCECCNVIKVCMIHFQNETRVYSRVINFMCKTHCICFNIINYLVLGTSQIRLKSHIFVYCVVFNQTFNYSNYTLWSERLNTE